MFTIIYDRDFRKDLENSEEWTFDKEPPDIAPHRIIEFWADGEERQHLEAIINGGRKSDQPTAEMGYYGDLARTMFINL